MFVQCVICVVVFFMLLVVCVMWFDNVFVVDCFGLFGMIVIVQFVVLFGLLLFGFYCVKLGDMLYWIVFENGQNYCDIVLWNNLVNLNQIEVDQLLCVVLLGGVVVVGVLVVVLIVGGVVVMVLLSSGLVVLVVGMLLVLVVMLLVVVIGLSDMVVVLSGFVMFVWFVCGFVLNGFDDVKNKGVNIGGMVGEVVKVVVDGCVVYFGNGLCGYGNFIIIKYDVIYFMVYVYNCVLMVKEGDVVMKGQKIVEMGNSDVDCVMLYFEVCWQGKFVDLLKYLLF